jgi:hypothetical protein
MGASPLLVLNAPPLHCSSTFSAAVGRATLAAIAAGLAQRLHVRIGHGRRHRENPGPPRATINTLAVRGPAAAISPAVEPPITGLGGVAMPWTSPATSRATTLNTVIGRRYHTLPVPSTHDAWERLKRRDKDL